MESEDDLASESPEIPSLPVEKRAGWWAWPAILLSVFFIGWSVNLFQPRVESEYEEKTGESAKSDDLALMKIQSQVVIAAAAFDRKQADDTLEELEGYVSGDRMRAAFVLLQSFVGDEEIKGTEVVDSFSDSASPALRRLMEKAIVEGLDDSEREELRRELGWFAELAPASDGGEPPESSAIRTKAALVLVLGVFLFMGAITGVVGGGVLLVLLLRKKRNDPGIIRFRSGDSPRGVMLECFAIYLGTMAMGEVGGILLHPGISIASYGLAVVFPFLWPLLRGVRWSDFIRSLGMHRGAGWGREIGAGFVGYLGVMAIASIGIFITLALSFTVGAVEMMAAGDGEAAGARPPGPETHPIVGWIYEGGMRERILCFLLAAGFAPIFEELFFRGALHRYLRGRFRFVASALLTGLIFAALHPQGWMGIPALA
ncbi:MAG: type II CAAX endopeptidase family protein, partial [Verrucomicrobiota bacterium]